MSLRIALAVAHRVPLLRPAAARPADDRAGPGRATVVLLTLAQVCVRPGPPQAFQQDRRAAGRAFPVHHDVPGHLDHDAARAHDRDAGAADEACRWRSSTCSSGYAIAFAALALRTGPRSPTGGCVRALGPARRRVDPRRSAALAVCNALLGMSLGLFVSAFARTEFQAVQFMPAFVFPQMLLCGLFVPRDEMAACVGRGLLRVAAHLRFRRASTG